MTERAVKAVQLSWGGLLQGSLILVSAVMAFAYLQMKAENNQVQIAEHRVEDEKRWEKNYVDMRDIRDDVEHIEKVQVEIRLSQKEQATHYAHILEEIRRLSTKLDQFEVTE